jgi:hypothetical protein
LLYSNSEKALITRQFSPFRDALPNEGRVSGAKLVAEKVDFGAERAKGPGLKPIETIGLIQGAEAPCSLRKAKAGVFPQTVRPLTYLRDKKQQLQ